MEGRGEGSAINCSYRISVEFSPSVVLVFLFAVAVLG